MIRSSIASRRVKQLNASRREPALGVIMELKPRVTDNGGSHRKRERGQAILSNHLSLRKKKGRG